jgi:hypothetical protein
MIAKTSASDGNLQSQLELLKSQLAKKDAKIAEFNRKIQLLEAQRRQEPGSQEV